MVVTRLACQGFRNLEDGEIFPCSGVNVIYGDNAQGKTNLLEGLWLFTGGHSFRGAKDTELPRLDPFPGENAPAAALALGRLCSPGKAAGKWAAFLCLGSCLAESAYFANRTLPLLCALLLAAQAWKWLLRPTGEPKLRRCAGILFALLFLALALRGNLWGLRSWLLSLPLTRRLLNPGEGLSRLEIWSAFFRGGRWLRFPLGGNRLTQGLPFTWFHNLWLDLYCHGGALPFLLFSAFTLLELRHSLAFFRTMKAVRWERSRNAAANLLPALLLNAMVEPVMEANVYVFLTALLFLGAVRGQRLRALKEAEAFQPSTPATPSREEVLRL